MSGRVVVGWATTTAVALAVCVGLGSHAGCVDHDETPRARDLGASSSSFDGGLGAGALDASRVAKPRDSGAADPPVIPSAPAAACARGPLPSPADLCEQPDSSEPNSHRAPARLTLDPTCALVSALAADKDEDAYRFSAPKSDPVSIELSYTSERRADLAIDVRDLDDRSVARVDDLRSGPTEQLKKVIRAGAGATYDVRVDGANIGLCQSYSLRVDAHYCTDSFEDNDTEGTANKLSFGGDQKVELVATAHQDDHDFYEYTTARADPVHIAGSYTANPGDDIVLRRIIGPTRGASAIDETGTRSGPMASFEHWMRSPTAGESFRIEIYPTGSGCAAYQLTLDAAACSDAFEDNDEPKSAAKLVLAEDLSATAFYGDPDFYDLSALAQGGSCTITYVVAAGTTQRLRADVTTASAGTITSGVGTGSTTKTIALSWPARPVTELQIVADTDGVCQPYVLRCSAAAAGI